MRVDANLTSEALIAKYWSDIESLLGAISIDVESRSLVDIEVGVVGLLTLVNKIRHASNHRTEKLPEAEIGSLCDSVEALKVAVASVGSSTATQTGIVDILQKLIVVEQNQDVTNLPQTLMSVLTSRLEAGHAVAIDIGTKEMLEKAGFNVDHIPVTQIDVDGN